MEKSRRRQTAAVSLPRAHLRRRVIAGASMAAQSAVMAR
jgi:hypothetical protein